MVIQQKKNPQIRYSSLCKNKQKKRRRRTYIGKSDWEKMCDDGGNFYGW